MIVEFIGIAMFSFIMSSFNTMLFSDDSIDQIDEQLEKVDIWLVKLDNSRYRKQLPNILVDQIKDYIKESFSYDFRKLIDGYDFLE